MFIKLFEENLDSVFTVKRGELVVICSRPAGGKTLFLATLSSNFLKNEVAFTFFNFENNTQSLIDKINATNNVNYQNVLSSSIVDGDSLNKEKFISKISNGVSVVLVDGLQLLTLDGLNSTAEKLEFLKDVAVSKNTAVIVTSQVGRRFEKIKPSGKLTSKLLIESKVLNEFINQKFVDKVAFLDKPYARLSVDNFSLNKQNNKVDFVIVKNNCNLLTVVELSLKPWFSS